MPKREINIGHFRIQHSTTMQYNTTLYHTILYGTQYFTTTHTWHIIRFNFFILYLLTTTSGFCRAEVTHSTAAEDFEDGDVSWKNVDVSIERSKINVPNIYPKNSQSGRFTRTPVESTKTKPNFKMKHLSSIRLNSFCFLRVPRPISKSHNACHFLGLPETQCEVQVTWLQTPTSCQMAKWGH